MDEALFKELETAIENLETENTRANIAYLIFAVSRCWEDIAAKRKKLGYDEQSLSGRLWYVMDLIRDGEKG